MTLCGREEAKFFLMGDLIDGNTIPRCTHWCKVRCPGSSYVCKMKSSLLVRRETVLTLGWFVIVQSVRGSSVYYREARRILKSGFCNIY